MKILITGANGYIGSHVVTSLIDKGIDVVACDVATNHIDSRAEIVQYDILGNCNKDNAWAFFGQPDVCLHLAWRDGFIHNSSNHIKDLSAHYSFLTNLIDNGLKHIAIMGTMHEVGYHEGKIDETTACNPLSLYGIAKNTLRQSMLIYCATKM